MPPDPLSFVPLRSVELHILLSTVEGPRHGYGILKDAEDRCEGEPGFEIPTLYRALRRIREAGMIESAPPPDPDVDERRDHWSATSLGRQVLDAELRRLERLLEAGRSHMTIVPDTGRT